MRIGVIGGGAIGLLVANQLAAHHEVTLYVRRQEQLNHVRIHSILLYEKDLFSHARQVDVRLDTNVRKEHVYIVCVKQHHLEALFPVLQKLDDTSHLLFLQNGMGHLAIMDKLTAPTYVGIVSHGAKRESDWQVNHLGKGAIQVAGYGKEAKNAGEIAALLHQSEFPVQSVADWEPLLKHKLIVNAVINPLTAIFNVANGEILAQAGLATLAKRLCAETADVLDISFDEAWQHVHDTAIATKENTSSMRADIQEGRQTEIDAITGYILQQAEETLPFSDYVYEVIIDLQKRSR